METILGYLGIGLAAIALLAVLPITKEIVRPILSSFGELFVWFGKEMGAWLIFLMKEILNSHRVLFDHLTNKKTKFDTEEMVKEIQSRR